METFPGENLECASGCAFAFDFERGWLTLCNSGRV